MPANACQEGIASVYTCRASKSVSAVFLCSSSGSIALAWERYHMGKTLCNARSRCTFDIKVRIGMGDPPPPIVFLPSFPRRSNRHVLRGLITPPSLKSRVQAEMRGYSLYLRVCGRKGWSGKRRERTVSVVVDYERGSRSLERIGEYNCLALSWFSLRCPCFFMVKTVVLNLRKSLRREPEKKADQSNEILEKVGFPNHSNPGYT